MPVSDTIAATNDRDRPSRGWRRMRELRREAEAERKALAAELLAGLGRPVTAFDRVAIETLAAVHVRARRLEAQGKSAIEERKQATQIMRGLGLRPAPPVSPKADPGAALQEYLAAKYGTPPVAQNGAGAPATGTRASEAAGGHSEASA